MEAIGAGRSFGQRLGNLIEDEIHEALEYLQSWST